MTASSEWRIDESVGFQILMARILIPLRPFWVVLQIGIKPKGIENKSCLTGVHTGGRLTVYPQLLQGAASAAADSNTHQSPGFMQGVDHLRWNLVEDDEGIPEGIQTTILAC
ncbi:hypothetical protein Tco_0580501 [Tanacetum coccineum]